GVNDERKVCDYARQAIVKTHEEHYDGQANQTCDQALANRLFAEGGTDSAAFYNFHWNRKGAVAKLHSESIGCVRCEIALDNPLSVSDGIFDGWSKNDALIQNNGEDLSDVRGCKVSENLFCVWLEHKADHIGSRRGADLNCDRVEARAGHHCVINNSRGCCSRFRSRSGLSRCGRFGRGSG